MLPSIEGEGRYQRVSPEMLVQLSLSHKRVTPEGIAVKVLTVALLILASVGYFVGAPLIAAVIGIAIIEGTLGCLVPWGRISNARQEFLHESRQVPLWLTEEVSARSRLVEGIEAGTWVCRKKDFEDQGKRFRKEHGPRAGDPDARFGLVIAFVWESGGRVSVVAGGDAVAVWTSQTHMYLSSCLPEEGRWPLPSGIGSEFQEILRGLINAPLHPAEILDAVDADKREVRRLALRAQHKWGLVAVDGSNRLVHLTEIGQFWLSATAEGYTERMRTKRGRNLGNGPSVTNNYYGSNVVHGTHHGPMQVDGIGQVGEEAYAPADFTKQAKFPNVGEGVYSPNGERPYAFISYSSEDKIVVRRLCSRLARDGVQCWFDERDLRPGQDWSSEIYNAIRRSRWVVICLTHRSRTKAGYVQRELRRALELAEEQPEGRAFIIPVRLEPCDIPDRLRHLQWVDLFQADGYRRLVDALRLSLEDDIS